jgi:hypothetical protein
MLDGTEVSLFGKRLIKLRFSSGGNGIPHLLHGWSVPEPEFVWASGAESAFVVAAPVLSGVLWLTLDLYLHIERPELPAQRVMVEINGIPCGYCRLTERRRHVSLQIPPQALAARTPMVVTLRHPDGKSPRDLRVNSDDRVLSAALCNATIVMAETPPHAAVGEALAA